jgi:flavin-dependent dehydrogenase
VVAADGRLSRVAKQAGVPAREHPNNRFTYFTYYRDLPLSGGANSQYWHLDPGLAYAFRNDGGTTLLGMFRPFCDWPAFKADIPGNFHRFWDGLPDGPRIGAAEPLCPLRGYTQLPNQWRPAAAPGIAFVGDAAMVTDPIWGCGCSFAFLAADWLVEATLPALTSARRSTAAIDRGLRRYRRTHRAKTWMHYGHIAGFSRVRRENPIEKLVFSAATRDPEVAARVLTYLGRLAGPISLASPAVLGRAASVNLRHMTSSRRSAPTASMIESEGVSC